MGNTEAQYTPLEEDTFGDCHVKKPRNYDCVMVFNIGDKEADWQAPEDGKLNYEYLSLLEKRDIEERKELFPQHGADFTSQRTKEKDFFKNERKLVIKALSKMNVKCKYIKQMKDYEKDPDIKLKFFYVGIGETTARKFAEKIEYELELDPDSAIQYLQLMDEPLAKATMDDQENAENCHKDLWLNVYIKFNNHVAPQIYKAYDLYDEADEKEGYNESLFRIRDRMAIIEEIVIGDVQLGGCGINVPALVEKDHCIKDFFPLHTQEHLHYIISKFFGFRALTVGILELPLEEIRVYFGEYLSIYFAYLEFLTIYLLPLSIVGLLIQFVQLGENTILIPGLEYFALAVIVWAVFFPILWKRKEFQWALKWGTLRFDQNERARAEFDGDYVRSAINGEIEEYFPTEIRASRIMVSLSVMVVFLVALFGSVVAVVVLRYYVSKYDIDYGSTYVSVANALVIMIFNNIYGVIAEHMNEWENYKTDTEYENALIIKVFLFRFVNSYATLYYMAFVRPYEDESSGLSCADEECMVDLRSNLATIFLTQLTVSNAIELGSVFAGRLAGGGGASYFTDNIKDRIWNEYASEVYERTFDDYCELLISVGYATLFVISFPASPFLAFLGCVIEARIDGYKICALTRRPFPRQADDVGAWQTAMEVMGWSVLVTNLGLICFVIADLKFGFLDLGSDTFEEVVTALTMFGILACAHTCLNCFIAGRPHEIDVHMQRQDHIEKEVEVIGEGIDRYLDSLTASRLKSWDRWPAEEVAMFLKEMVFRNPEIYKQIKEQIKHVGFDGKQFAGASPNILEKRLDIKESLQQQFIFNARDVLKRVQQRVKKEDELFREEETMNRGLGQDREQFDFTDDHLLQMAEFFEADLTGQSKRKLWTKVDKDMSSLIEANEMENFLYFSIVVFVKARYENVRLPKKSDKRFQKKVLHRLKRWMLQYKVSAQGLRFDEFDQFFPGWLREYHRETKSAEAGNLTKYSTINMDAKNAASSTLDDEVQRKKLKEEENLRGKSKLAGLFGSDSTLTERPSVTSSKKKKKERERDDGIDRSSWTAESKEWEGRLAEIARAIRKTDEATRRKIWDKFDRQGTGSLDCDKSLSRLIYSFFALYIKTKDRDGKPPKYQQLKPLLSSVCSDIRKMINSVTGDASNNQISKEDFVKNIADYLAKIADRRK